MLNRLLATCCAASCSQLQTIFFHMCLFCTFFGAMDSETRYVCEWSPKSFRGQRLVTFLSTPQRETNTGGHRMFDSNGPKQTDSGNKGYFHPNVVMVERKGPRCFPTSRDEWAGPGRAGPLCTEAPAQGLALLTSHDHNKTKEHKSTEPKQYKFTNMNFTKYTDIKCE